ncbi:hypothetical protein H5996_03970 [Faecalicoccus pleomorphus]|uniref:hypothetical protein n=1 Tax=Faecalicoccus pleomorphus TaxID=1323 RepID=UPI001961D131|nr:hypothetical protein [Faecalicoccus pleomorphus]MBM6765064.1 hypothetical protein [Faecalicoccus pleomorphus]
MVTNLIMFCILIFLGLTILMGARISDMDSHFFNKDNSNALRGFWCLIVILVFGLIDTIFPRLNSGEFIVLRIAITVILAIVAKGICDFIYRI